MNQAISIISSDEFKFSEFVFDRMRIQSPSSDTEFESYSLTEFTQNDPVLWYLEVFLLKQDISEKELTLSSF